MGRGLRFGGAALCGPEPDALRTPGLLGLPNRRSRQQLAAQSLVAVHRLAAELLHSQLHTAGPFGRDRSGHLGPGGDLGIAGEAHVRPPSNATVRSPWPSRIAAAGPAESVVLYLPRIYAAIDHSASAASGPVLVGYLSVTEGSEDSVVELIGSSLTSELEMLQQWVLEHGRPSGRGNSHSDGNYSCALRLAPWRLKLIRQVGKFAERQVLETDHNWQIFDWRSTLTACFALKTAAMLPEWSTLVCGMVRLTIQDSGSFEILVRADNVVTVEQVPEFQIDVSTATLPHELIVEPREALRLAFGPAQPTAVLPIPSTLAPMLCSWFPLPLFTDGPDSV